MTDLPNNLGRYVLRERIGSGAMGAVFRGEDPVIGRTVAIKAIHTDLLNPDDRAQHLARFKVEVKSAGRCQHSNIVAIYDYLEEAGEPYIVMEFAAGRSLRHLMAEQRRFPVPAAVDLIGQLLAALGHAHGRGVVHRDVKPANLIIDEDRRLKVIDFGIARLGGGDITVNGMMLGTPAFMAPEQLMGNGLDHRADLFAAGMVLLHLVTGRSPYKGANLAQILLELAADRPINLHRAGEVDPRLTPVLTRALAKRPEDRFETADAFAQALATAVALPDDSELWPSAPAAAATGFQPAFLERVERELTEVTGPIARILVRDVSKRAATEEQLISQLAARVPDARNRSRFLRSFAQSAPGGAATGPSLTTGTGTTGRGLPVSPEAMEAVQTLLVSFIGPFGRILVRQSSLQAASVSQFYDQLAVHIKHEKDREAFRKKFAAEIALKF
jgi:eukaryotic-like serine/threonine-protein kinase